MWKHKHRGDTCKVYQPWNQCIKAKSNTSLYRAEEVTVLTERWACLTAGLDWTAAQLQPWLHLKAVTLNKLQPVTHFCLKNQPNITEMFPFRGMNNKFTQVGLKLKFSPHKREVDFWLVEFWKPYEPKRLSQMFKKSLKVINSPSAKGGLDHFTFFYSPSLYSAVRLFSQQFFQTFPVSPIQMLERVISQAT